MAIEIVIPGLKDISGGMSEKSVQQLEQLRQLKKLHVWSCSGKAEDVEKSWQEFLLADTPDWQVFGG